MSQQPVWQARLIAVVAAVVAAVVVWLATDVVLDLDVRTPEMGGQPGGPLGVGMVIGATAVNTLLGWGLLALLEKTAKARTTWTAIAVVFTVLSFAGPFLGEGASTSSRISLLCMHLAVAAVYIPLMRRTTSDRVAVG